jgi:hypothetical protein
VQAASIGENTVDSALNHGGLPRSGKVKIEKDNNILKILNSKATLHKHPIYTLESSKHPLNLVRLSL